ncbi:hypothetical protein INN84_16935, partial [Staphylococcus aureus]|nr:hypothetical protein [Staphylococcus aureus]
MFHLQILELSHQGFELSHSIFDQFPPPFHDYHLNQGLDYLMSALTFDNETVKLGETLSKDLYGKEINASVSRF